jgi:heat shock protein HtpX
MPLTYIDIEKQKTWRIGIFFLILLFMYFCVTFALLQGIGMFVFPFVFMKTGGIPLSGKPLYLLAIFGSALFMAAIHFWFSASDAVHVVMKSLGATVPDREDGIHKRLLNILDEIHVVTGNRRIIQCMVIPSLSMNAIAVADLKGNAAIGITEGLLSRLSRDQTEAVLAHETYHILSGDCMETTVATSLFGIYAAMIENLRNLGDEDRHGLHPAFFLFWLLLKLSQLLSMFISREREYRADAAAVRMTRNPLSLAEALHMISRNWRGSSLIGSGLEMLCIMNLKDDASDESGGFWSDLMSTHPPAGKRIDILLRMARKSIGDLEKQAEKTPAVSPGAPGQRFFVLNQEKKWAGPFSAAELASLPWFSPRSWIIRESGKDVRRAAEDTAAQAIFTEISEQSSGIISKYHCPLCKQSLIGQPYEKTRVYACRYCGGVLVDSVKIPRIIARREQECTERIASLAKAVINDNQRKLSLKRLKGAGNVSTPLLSCPQCHNPMMRTFYSLAYLIEIDRCGYCGLTWFDTDELEMLQCLIENRIMAALDFSQP